MERWVVLQNELLQVEELPEERVLILHRLPTRAADSRSLSGTYEEAFVSARPYEGWALVIDMREAPPRNDADFESAIGPIRKRLDQMFTRVVTLVATSAGALQVRRLARERGLEALVTHDEDEALRMCRDR